MKLPTKTHQIIQVCTWKLNMIFSIEAGGEILPKLVTIFTPHIVLLKDNTLFNWKQTSYSLFTINLRARQFL